MIINVHGSFIRYVHSQTLSFSSNPSKLHLKKGYWTKQENVENFLKDMKEKLNLHSPADWHSITVSQIISTGGKTLLSKYSIYDIKCLACPEGKSIFGKANKPVGYWEDKQNVTEFLEELKHKLNLKTPENWNSITKKQIQAHGGSGLFNKYSIFDLKEMGCPGIKLLGDKIKNKPGYWDKERNVILFLQELQKKLNLQNPNDWNSITISQIKSNGGRSLLNKYSLYDLKCLGCPEGKLIFDPSYKSNKFWEDKKNILNFLKELKYKLNLKTPTDWNLLTTKQIQSNGGRGLLNKYSMYDIKCLGCPEGESIFTISPKSINYWDNKENIILFLQELQKKLNLNNLHDWNSVSKKQIIQHGGIKLFDKFSLNELKSIGFPDGKLYFNTIQKSYQYWDKLENVYDFLNQIKEKLNLKTPEDWNLLTNKQIQSMGGYKLLHQYSLFDLKSLGCPNGKLIFENSNKTPKPAGYWENQDHVLQFLNELKENLNLQSPEDWNLITQKQIKSFGGSSLLSKYSMFDLKCLGCPNGKHIFDSEYKPVGYWNEEQNIKEFLDELKEKLNLNTVKDWSRVSKHQIISQGGRGLTLKFPLHEIIQMNHNDFVKPMERASKRSSQRWLFLQIQKLFPGEEIVEDYFHDQISRENGFSVQFDIFLVKRNIAIEYHGKQHFEDIPTGFGPVELYQKRDQEKARLCEKYGIHLIIIPYWWDNSVDSLKATLDTNIEKSS